MRFTLWVWCCWLSINAFGHAGDLLLFQGKMEGVETTFEITGHEEYWNLRLFHHDDLVDQYFTGTKKDSTWEFVSTHSSYYKIKIRAGKTWRFKVVLSPKKYSFYPRYIQVDDPEKAYFRAKVEKMVFQELGQEDGPITMKELKSGVTFFRSTFDDINSELAKIHVNMAFKALSCEWKGDTSPIQVNYEVFRHDSVYLSYRLEILDNCSGNFTDHKLTYHTWEMATQQEIQLEALVYFGMDNAPDYQTQPWFTYRYQKFPGFLMALLEIEVQCLNDKKLWQFPDWYLTTEGVCFLPFTYNKKEGCDYATPYCVGYEEFDGYWNGD